LENVKKSKILKNFTTKKIKKNKKCQKFTKKSKNVKM